jgi:hypothetical protein
MRKSGRGASWLAPPIRASERTVLATRLIQAGRPVAVPVFYAAHR